jgi:hypothetical protein
MSVTYNPADAATRNPFAVGAGLARPQPRRMDGLLISPEGKHARAARGAALKALFWLGIGLLLSVSTLIFALISLAHS